MHEWGYSNNLKFGSISAYYQIKNFSLISSVLFLLYLQNIRVIVLSKKVCQPGVISKNLCNLDA